MLPLLSVLIFFGCSVHKDASNIFKDTYMSILKKSVVDFRYIKPPTYEQSQKGVKIKKQKRPDTLSPLKIYVQREHIEVNFDQLKKRLSELPPSFINNFTDSIINYIPVNIETFSNNIYEFIPFKNLDEVFETDIPSQSDFGGVIQFSKLLLNKKGDKAFLFIRKTRHSLNSVESLYLLEKHDRKWKKVKSFGISRS
ncbi:hypothetical protein JYU17_00580 [Flavobacteriaceae bacterium AH-315-O20]|nr:hypothetical protein [Flavobacteriaceae bacterium AH-315-O20]